MKKFYSAIILLLALAGSFAAEAQRADYNVIPLPKEVIGVPYCKLLE